MLHRTIRVTKQAQNVGQGRVVGPPKSAAGNRVVTIPATLAVMLYDHLATYVKVEPDALVFTSDEGLPMHRGRWAFVWHRAAKAAGYEGLHFHDLRHHAGTLAAQLGATTKEIMDRLGHSTMRASLIYQYSTQERQRSWPTGWTPRSSVAPLVSPDRRKHRRLPSLAAGQQVLQQP